MIKSTTHALPSKSPLYASLLLSNFMCSNVFNTHWINLVLAVCVWMEGWSMSSLSALSVKRLDAASPVSINCQLLLD